MILALSPVLSIDASEEVLLQPREQATFDAAELAVVLSHYELGVIESITDFPRGSRRSPKVGIVSERGKFLLKRRSLERAHPDRIRFAHHVQRHLAASGSHWWLWGTGHGSNCSSAHHRLNPQKLGSYGSSRRHIPVQDPEHPNEYHH